MDPPHLHNLNVDVMWSNVNVLWSNVDFHISNVKNGPKSYSQPNAQAYQGLIGERV